MTAPVEVDNCNNSNNKIFPVIIAGAGPCGLVAALTLQKHNVPFVVYERASRERLCSNAGSGIDMAPTAVDILGNKLKINMSKAMSPYESMYIGSMKGNKKKSLQPNHTYSSWNMKDIPNCRDFGFSNRSDLQNSLLDSLTEGLKKEEGQEEKSILCCNTEIVEYTNKGDRVDVTILTRDKETGTKTKSVIEGSVLLACDGIHSAIRRHMNRNVQDDYNHCGQACWWGKCVVVPGSDLFNELRRLQKEHNLNGKVAVSMIGNSKSPSTFFSCLVSEDTHAWVYMEKEKNPKEMAANQSNDLTRRGGTVLDESMKRSDLVEPLKDSCSLAQLIINGTKASDITRAGFFDRKNLDLPYVDDRVALLGDAAHPQSPMMGQGANMAIVDGYVVATRLADAAFHSSSSKNGDSFVKALADFDCDERRKSCNKVIKTSRSFGKLAVSENRLKNWLMKQVVKYTPPSMVISQDIASDISNKVFVESMEKDLKLNNYN